MDNPVLSNIFGTAGAVCWSIQLLPQILKNYRHHSTEGLHPMMYLSWAIAGIPLAVYNLVQNLNVALQVQPHILIVLSLVTWSQCKFYGDQWSVFRVTACATGIAGVIGAVDVGLYFGLKEAWDKGHKWPMTLMAVLAAVLLCVGVMRYYWEIYKARDVKGISFTFVTIDWAGDIVSILALAFAPRLDVVGMIIYCTEAVLWLGIQLLGVYFRFLPWLFNKCGRDLREVAKKAQTGEAYAEVNVAVSTVA